jgi:hypothetical protein
LPSANALPSAALGKGYTTKILSAKTSLPSAFCQALGKAFVGHSQSLFRVPLWQRKDAVTAHETLTDALSSAPLLGTRQRIFFKKLCRVSVCIALGKEKNLKNYLPSALPWHSAKKIFF